MEGLQIALDNLDAVIRTIREAQSTEEARAGLVSRFGLSEVQANAILDMQLRRLVALERQRILDELAELRRAIVDLEDVLARPERVLTIIKEELAYLKGKYGDPRRTVILPHEEGELSEEDLIPRHRVLVMLTERGYVKRMPPSVYRLQNRGGRGVTGMTTRDDDEVRQLFVASTHDSCLFFTNRGRVLRARVWELPDVQRQARGQALINVINLEPDERVDHLPAHLGLRGRGQPRPGHPAGGDQAQRAGGLRLGAPERDQDDGRGGGRRAVLGGPHRGHGRGGPGHRPGPGRRPSPNPSCASPGAPAEGCAGSASIPAMSWWPCRWCDPEGSLLMITGNGIGKQTPFRRVPPPRPGGSGVRAIVLDERTGPLVAAQAVDAETKEIVAITRHAVVIRHPRARRQVLCTARRAGCS